MAKFSEGSALATSLMDLTVAIRDLIALYKPDVPLPRPRVFEIAPYVRWPIVELLPGATLQSFPSAYLYAKPGSIHQSASNEYTTGDIQVHQQWIEYKSSGPKLESWFLIQCPTISMLRHIQSFPTGNDTPLPRIFPLNDIDAVGAICQSLAWQARYQPAVIVRTIRRIECASKWVQKRIEGRRRHSQMMLNHQGWAVEQLRKSSQDAELPEPLTIAINDRKTTTYVGRFNQDNRPSPATDVNPPLTSCAYQGDLPF